MVRIFLGFFASLIISNWLYAELVLFFPQSEHALRRLTSHVEIPTHDQWAKIGNSKGGALLHAQLQQEMSTSTFRAAFKQLGILSDSTQKYDRSEETIAASSHLFKSGADIFIEFIPGTQIYGGYEVFSF